VTHFSSKLSNRTILDLLCNRVSSPTYCNHNSIRPPSTLTAWKFQSLLLYWEAWRPLPDANTAGTVTKGSSSTNKQEICEGNAGSETLDASSDVTLLPEKPDDHLPPHSRHRLRRSSYVDQTQTQTCKKVWKKNLLWMASWAQSRQASKFQKRRALWLMHFTFGKLFL
jgi:hypothetical protein